jgi:hypothetical protein
LRPRGQMAYPGEDPQDVVLPDVGELGVDHRSEDDPNANTGS